MWCQPQLFVQLSLARVALYTNANSIYSVLTLNARISSFFFAKAILLSLNEIAFNKLIKKLKPHNAYMAFAKCAFERNGNTISVCILQNDIPLTPLR